MSAEKEIVDFWLNKKGFFTINNIKSSNRDLGIIALKDKQLQHYDVLCSITSSQKEFTDENIDEKFSNESVQKVIEKYLGQFNLKESKRFVVLSNISDKNIKKFKDFEVLEFENILSDVIKDLDTQYYKNDVIRSLQLLKYLFLTNSKNVSDILVNETLTSNERKEFMKSLLDKDEIVKEFRKTNEERLSEILKYSTLKNPEKLAELLEKNVLNRKTRKPFLSSLLEQRKIKKLYKEEFSTKKETPLNKFF